MNKTNSQLIIQISRNQLSVVKRSVLENRSYREMSCKLLLISLIVLLSMAIAIKATSTAKQKHNNSKAQGTFGK